MTDTKATLAEEEFGWVIERGDSSPSSPTYWSGPDYWSQDHMDAVRFARKQDAERVACRVHGGYHRICEHGWRNNPTPPAVEASDDLELVKLAIRDALIQAQPIFGQRHQLIDFMEPIARAAIAAIRREAAASPTRDAVIEECWGTALRYDHFATNTISGPAREYVQGVDDAQKGILDSIRALKSPPAPPTELEKELTAALRHCYDRFRFMSDGDTLHFSEAALAKATERGL